MKKLIHWLVRTWGSPRSAPPVRARAAAAPAPVIVGRHRARSAIECLEPSPILAMLATSPPVVDAALLAADCLATQLASGTEPASALAEQFAVEGVRLPLLYARRKVSQ